MNSAVPNPILERWKSIAQQRSGALAVVEAGSGHSWTFDALRAAGEAAANPSEAGHAIDAAGQGADFVVSVLGAWEAGQVVCPREPDAMPPPADSCAGARTAFPEAVLAKTTSGTTGAPRHILFSADQLAADADAIVRTMHLHAGQPQVSAISLAHSYGFSNLVLPLLLHGIPLVIAASPLPSCLNAALDLVASGTLGGRQAAVPGVPAMWRAWLAAGVVDARRLGLALSAGAPLPLPLEQLAAHHHGLKIHNFLGSSECGGIAFDRSLSPRTIPTLAGTPLDGVRLFIDPDGRLVVRSRAVGLAYWPPVQADDALQPGSFRTGDVAEERPDGWHLLGRATETLNLAGRKLHPSEIECLLRAHPAVQECLVFGIPSPDPIRKEEVVAAVALDPAASSDWQSLPAWLATQIPPWKRPRHWWPCPDLSPTTRGKFSRTHWREKFLALEPAHRRE